MVLDVSRLVQEGKLTRDGFERLGAQPWAVIVAGLTAVAVAVALWRYNAARAAAASPRLAA